MNAADLRFLFGYDRWATDRVLMSCAEVDEAVWLAPNAIDERGLAAIMVHALGAHQRWRHGLSGRSGTPRPERAPLPTVGALHQAWLVEWAAMDAWLTGLDDAAATSLRDGLPVWQLLAHLANHGTQHRSEAAVLLTSAGHSPGDLDMIDYVERLAGGGDNG